MANTINAAVVGIVLSSDSSGGLDIQAGGVNAIQVGTSASVSVSNLAVTTLSVTSANITTATGTTFSATTMGAQSTTTFLGTSANITTITGTTIGTTATTQLRAASANITTITGTAATFTTSSDGVGNLRNIPSVGAAKTSEYTLTTSDIGEFVTVGTSGKVLVPNNTFVAGNVFSIYNDTTGNVSINLSTTTAYLVGTNTNRTGVTLATRGIATVLVINPSYCIVSGNLT